MDPLLRHFSCRLQVANRTWEELNAEAQLSLPEAEPGVGDGDSRGAAQESGDGLEWLSLWGVERSSLPEWFTSWQTQDNAVRNKVRKVVNEEWVYMEDRDGLIGEGEAEQNIPKKSGLPPPGPPLLDESERYFDVGAYLRESTVFPFVLMESFWKYSSPTMAAAGVEAGKEEAAV